MSRPSFLGIVTLFSLVIAVILFQLMMYERLEHIENFIGANKFTMKPRHTTSPKTDLAPPQLEEKARGEHVRKDIVTSAPDPITAPPPAPPPPVPATADLVKTSPPDRPRTAIVVPESFDPFEERDNLEIDEVCRSLGKATIISPNSKKWTCGD